MGGALASPGMASGVKVAGNDVFVKAGTYNISSATPKISGGAVLDDTGAADQDQSHWVGYDTTRTILNTDATRPLFLATGGTNYKMFEASALAVTVRNIRLDGADLTGVEGWRIAANFGGSVLINCFARRCVYGFYVGQYSDVYRCEATECSLNAFYVHGGGKLWGCWAHDNDQDGIVTAEFGAIHRCVSNRNGRYGLRDESSGYAFYNGCVAFDNVDDGIHFTTSFSRHHLSVNCISVNNGGYGFGNSTVTTKATQLLACAHYGNTSGAVEGSNTIQDRCITLTGNPFVDAANDDFSLNNTAGAGAALKGAAYPMAFL